MSASPVFSSAATGRPFIFAPCSSAETSKNATVARKKAATTAKILAQVGTASKLAAVVPATRLDVRQSPEMVSSGIPQLDALTGGLARGCLTEICGTASSGRTSVLLSALAHATQRGEICALVDASDAFDPGSAAAAGMEMSRLLWVRCEENFPQCKANHHAPARTAGCTKTGDSHHDLLSGDSYQGMPSGLPQISRKTFGFGRCESQLSQMLRVADLLLQSNGFGMIALDLGDIPAQSARRIPLASWFRFRRAIEHTPTALLILEQQPIAGSCSSLLVRVSGKKPSAAGSQLAETRQSQSAFLSHTNLLDQVEITAELLRSRLENNFQRRPSQSVTNFMGGIVYVTRFRLIQCARFR